MAEHTPGPWVIPEKEPTGGRFWRTPEIYYTNDDDGIHMSDADARLIAAAPKSYETLIAISTLDAQTGILGIAPWIRRQLGEVLHKIDPERWMNVEETREK